MLINNKEMQLIFSHMINLKIKDYKSMINYNQAKKKIKIKIKNIMNYMKRK